MNFQDFLYPIQDAMYGLFAMLEVMSDNFNLVLMAAVAFALIYWTLKLVGYQKDEVINR